MEEPWYLPEGYDALLQGAEITVLSSSLGIVFATLIGIIAGLAYQSKSSSLRAAVAVYVSMIRGTPLYMQVLVVYFIFPAIGIDIPPLAAGVAALALNSGAYISQMIRGAITAIPPGHLEAARALALPEPTIWRRIVTPQALRLILPPLTLEFSAVVKNSAFLAIIGVIELTRKAQEVISVSYNPTPTWLVVAAAYFVFCFAIGLGARRLERATNAQSFS